MADFYVCVVERSESKVVVIMVTTSCAPLISREQAVSDLCANLLEPDFVFI